MSIDKFSQRAKQQANSGGSTLDLCDRRSEPRYPTDSVAAVVILGDERNALGVGRIVNVSKSGFQLTVREAVAVGAKVRVAFGESLAFGEVRWCRSRGDGLHDIGVLVSHTVDRTLVENVRKAAANRDADGA